MRVSFRLSKIRMPRPLHSLRQRIVLVILILCWIQQQRLFFLYRHALSIKYSPTVFNAGFGSSESRLWEAMDEGSVLQKEILENRAAWRVLGSGWEGSAFVYHDVVIKTFTPGRSPFRNCVPGPRPEKWPTEIPASLYFSNLMSSGVTNASSSVSRSGGFLPVKAYFLALDHHAVPKWHLVTPLLREGNLDALVKKLRSSGSPRGYNALDLQFRPALNRLLRTLDSMHRVGFCHDDIKPTNIFAESDLDWVLGDLGNVRHVSHPYHSSRIWIENGQLRDCRANDVVRTMKSYLSFLRSLSDDKSAFDAEFFKARSPVVKLYWWSVQYALTITAEDLLLQSVSHAFSPAPGTHPHEFQNCCIQQFWFSRMLLCNAVPLERIVKAALKTSLNEDLARFLAFTWLFGLPEVPCSSSCTSPPTVHSSTRS